MLKMTRLAALAAVVLAVGAAALVPLTGAAQPVGVLNGARTDGAPSRFDAVFRRPDGSTISFSLTP